MKGWCWNGMAKKRSFWILCLIIVSIAVLSGCSGEPSAKRGYKQEETGNGTNKSGKVKRSIVPLNIPEQGFGGIQGWLNDQTIVYLTNSVQNSSIYTYNIFSGKTVKLYESDFPIMSFHISPSKERLLIHSSSSTYEAAITILDNEGNTLAKKSIMSSEINFEWNPFNEDFILVTAFDEIWEFKVYVFNMQTNELRDSKLTEQPFAFWLTEDEFVYLDWDKNAPALFAPVVKQNMNETKREKMDLADVFQLFSFNDILLFISAEKNHQEKAAFSFYSNKFNPLKTIKIPQLTNYADWLIPYNDFNQRKQQFVTFRPLHNGAADTYNKGFELVKYGLNTDKETILFDNIENQPVSFSPDGNYLLYGHQFEKLINLHSKEIISLIK